LPEKKPPAVRHAQHTPARVKKSAVKNGQRGPSKPKGPGMSNRQLRAALRRTKPETFGDLAPSAGASTTDTDRQEARADRALEEVMAAAGCPIGPANDSSEKRSAAVKKLFCDAVGVTHEPIAEQLISQIANAMNHNAFPSDSEKITGALAMMQEIKPANVNEALLACQMIGVHHAAMKFLHRATLTEQTFEGTDSNILRATRLMRLYIDQLEAMAKLKGKIGEQKVTVEHVHVHEGGQAIVGAVVTPKPSNGGGGQ
jgi:hypothetical protein